MRKKRRMVTQFTPEVLEWYDAYRYAFYNYGEDAKIASDLISDYRGKDRKILEVGSGTGNMAVELTKLGNEVDGIDNSPSMLDSAERKRVRYPDEFKDRIRFSLQNCQDLGEAKPSDNFRPPYGTVISHGLFYFIDSGPGLAFASYILDRDQNIETMLGIGSVTKPGGILLINEIRDYRPEQRKRQTLDLGKGGVWDVNIHATPYETENLSQEGRGLLTTEYIRRINGNTDVYRMEKVVFRKEDVEKWMRYAGFRFLEERLNESGTRGFYVARKE